jgi:hypothetical protein
MSATVLLVLSVSVSTTLPFRQSNGVRSLFDRAGCFLANVADGRR